MEDGEDRRADHGENRHRLGRPVDRRAPLLPQEAKNGGNQRAGMADADPENEVDDRPAPVDRRAMAPDADSRRHHVNDAADGARGDEAGDAEAPPPPGGRLALDYPADLVR